MSEFIFLTGQYLPKPGATGLCIHNIAKELASKGHKVTTICYDDGIKLDRADGVNIVKIRIPDHLKVIQTNNIFKKKTILFLSRLSKLINIRNYPLRSKSLIKKYAYAAEPLIKDENDIFVIASYVPLEAVAALEILKKKHPNVKTIYYSADTLSNEQGNSSILSQQKREVMGLKWEKRLFACSDMIFIMECHKKHYLSYNYNLYHNKMRIVNFPLLIRNEADCQIKNNECKTIVYCGTLYRKLRNPRFACEVLIEFLKEADYNVIFLGDGDCNDILNNAHELSDGKIQYLGMQPHQTAYQYILSADVLLSIGNNDSPMAPSKIYEYMAVGKPIIHFYTYEKDPCLEPLKKYGNALIVKENDADAVEKIRTFLKETRIVGFDSIKDLFLSSTPEYTANIILQKDD